MYRTDFCQIFRTGRHMSGADQSGMYSFCDRSRDVVMVTNWICKAGPGGLALGFATNFFA